MDRNLGMEPLADKKNWKNKTKKGQKVRKLGPKKCRTHPSPITPQVCKTTTETQVAQFFVLWMLNYPVPSSYP